MEDNVRALLRVISTYKKGRRFILGIDGLSRSGKTTLVSKLSKHLKDKNILVYIFHIDDHIVERSKRYHTDHEEWFEYYYLQWNINWLRDNLFYKLRFSNHLSLPFYDRKSDTCNVKSIQLPDSCIIIMEGVFLQRHEWRKFYDYVVFLDCSRGNRFQRENKNTQREILKCKNRYWTAEDLYLQTEFPKDNANLVING